MPDVRRNKDTDNIEIIYRNKPTQATRDALREAGFKWSPRYQLWYGVPTKKSLALATRIDPDFRPGPFRQRRAPITGPIASHTKRRAARRATKANARTPKTMEVIVLQGKFEGPHGWEDLSQYPSTVQGQKDCKSDLREYRFSGSGSYRTIRRRVRR